ncbi:hypothetical protein EDB80DRAFT_278348 [Ilyonectria destructans]|nr:hypothetical protein EDB80DRAFT_278348 [Ilyonectria destructans]
MGNRRALSWVVLSASAVCAHKRFLPWFLPWFLPCLLPVPPRACLRRLPRCCFFFGPHVCPSSDSSRQLRSQPPAALSISSRSLAAPALLAPPASAAAVRDPPCPAVSRRAAFRVRSWWFDNSQQHRECDCFHSLLELCLLSYWSIILHLRK